MDKQEFQIKRYKPKLFRQLMESNCGCDVEMEEDEKGEWIKLTKEVEWVLLHLGEVKQLIELYSYVKFCNENKIGGQEWMTINFGQNFEPKKNKEKGYIQQSTNQGCCVSLLRE